MKHLWLILPFLLLACPPPPPDVPPPPPPVAPGTDALETEEQKVMEPCPAACSRLEQLECEEAEPTPKGETCTEICERMEEGGIVSLNPDCIRHIQSCAQQEDCSPGN